MAVYERTYKRYTGPLSPQWSRLFVLPRYVYQDIFKSKFFVAFLVLSLIYPALCGALILIPRFAAWGAAALSVILLGAVYTHASTGIGSAFQVAPHLAFCAAVLWLRWPDRWLPGGKA